MVYFLKKLTFERLRFFTYGIFFFFSTHYRPGAVTIFALNLNKNEVTISLPAHTANSTIEAFVLQSAETGEQSLYSR